MSFKTKFKAAVIDRVLTMAPRMSDEGVLVAASMVEKIAPQKSKHLFAWLRHLFEKYPYSLIYAKRAITSINQNSRKKLLENLLLKGILDNYAIRIKNELKGHAPLFTLLISPTMRCNLKCKGCYALNYQRKEDLPFDVFNRIINQGKKMGVAYFTILGGEPFVYKNIFRIFENHKDTYFNVYTNGTLITEDVCKKLAELGNVSCMFSIEGFERETAYRRGLGVYEKVMQGMDLMKKHGIPFGYSVCVTKNNVAKIVSDEFIDLMRDKGALLGWYFLYMPVCGDKSLELMPSPSQRLFLKRRVDYIRDHKDMLLVDFWNDAPLVGGCIAGKMYAHVNNDGEVEPCIFTHFSQANIKNMSLQDALDMPFYKELRARQPYNKNLYMPCMLIDNPKVFRNLHKKYADLKPTHPEAQTLINDLKNEIDEYSSSMDELYAPVWEERNEKLN